MVSVLLAILRAILVHQLDIASLVPVTAISLRGRVSLSALLVTLSALTVACLVALVQLARTKLEGVIKLLIPSADLGPFVSKVSLKSPSRLL
jgi:hypothetical protein